jgi:hypothetical protein
MLIEEVIINEYRPNEGSKVVFVTGKLARNGLERVLEAIDPKDFSYKIRVLDVEVAAWLDVSTIYEQIGELSGIDVVVIPGKTTGDDEELSKMLNVQVVRGPNCYSELPVFLEELGFEPDSSMKAVPPKIIVLEDEYGVGEYLSQIYELKLIDPLTLAQSSGIDIAKHNQLAELVRSETILANGWVIKNYPNTLRDIQWLQEMQLTPDAIAAPNNIDNEVIEFYRDKPQFIMLNSSLDTKKMRENALVDIETLMQSCVNPDFGLADEK